MGFFWLHKLLFSSLLLFSVHQIHGAVYKPPNVERLTDRFSHVSVNQGFDHVFGGSNIRVTNNGSTVDLVLDKSSGSGLVSKNRFYYGFFSAAIKLPPGFTSGVVVAFYVSSLFLWFDPTLQYHQYSILWNSHHTVFLVDNIPVREVMNNNAIGSAYPSKPMSVYTTIWDGSEWATRGGKYPVNYKYAPFVASLGAMEMEGCVLHLSDSTKLCSTSGLSSLDPVEGQEFTKLSKQQIVALDWARGRRMFYSYCKDTSRYKVQPAECKTK